MNPTTKDSRPEGISLPVVQDSPVVPSKESPYNLSYWRSVSEKLEGHEKPDWDEFPPGSDQLDGVGRRDFVKLLSASMALAGVGLSGCAKPTNEKIIPYHKNPDGLTVGVAQHYASATQFGGYGTSVLVTAREGRPIKIDGNPDQPSTHGSSGSLEQAELLQMYDPHRAKLIKRDGHTQAKKGLQAEIASLVDRASKKDGGASIRFLTEPFGSPLLQDLRGQVIAKLPNAKFVSYDPVGRFNAHEGARLVFGRPVDVSYDLSKAKVIASLDADFLFAWGSNLGHAKAFGDRRMPGAEMNRLYVVEPSLTVTGSIADHRLRTKGSKVENVARALAAKLGLGVQTGSLDANEQKFVDALAADLKAAGNGAVVMAGERQPAAVHAIVHAINGSLGALGSTVKVGKTIIDDVATGPASLKTLADEINAGTVTTLVITAKNPVYASFADVDFGAAVKKAETFYLGLYEDETAAQSRWFLPGLHYLETWGDARAADGTVLLQQPLIDPIYGGIAETELLSWFAGNADVTPKALLEESWKRRGPVLAWERWLRDGVVAGTTANAEAVNVDAAALGNLPKSPEVSGFELQLRRDYKVHDGRVANLAWLQELPEPMTHIVWDNALLISPKTAQAMGILGGAITGETLLATGNIVKVTVRGKSLEMPVYVAAGHADDCGTLSLGYGRTSAAEKVAAAVGVNAYQLRYTDAPWFVGATAEKAAGSYKLVSTQEHWDMEKRDIALEANNDHIAEYAEHHLSHLKGKVPTLQDPVDYSKVDYKWGMAVDLSRCTGCMSCITACQAENNIPTVGRESVWRNREMHWIRVDQYFSGDLNEPGVISQPVHCQQCETAPCEYVCPVNATAHSDEGLNDMVYNRCIGTRYCSNNCPYKVRRFNYFHYTGEYTQVERLGKNPDVTVRARGVMEKCTWCVQRIEKGRIVARRENRKLADGEVTTACADACPTQAISFGNLNDPESQVSKKHADARSYNLLHELGTRPRNMYLARVKNLNPALASAGGAAEHTDQKEHH